MKIRKPAWWQLFVLVPIMFVLLGIEHFEPLPDVSVDLVVSGIVVFIFAAMFAWVHANGGLLEWYKIEEDPSYYDFKVSVYLPASRSNGDGKGSGQDERPQDNTAIAVSRSKVLLRHDLQMKEEGKWFLN